MDSRRPAGRVYHTRQKLQPGSPRPFCTSTTELQQKPVRTGTQCPPPALTEVSDYNTQYSWQDGSRKHNDDEPGLDATTSTATSSEQATKYPWWNDSHVYKVATPRKDGEQYLPCIGDFNFNPFSLRIPDHPRLYLQMFQSTHMVQHFGYRPEIISNYARTVTAKYSDVPFHNRFHSIGITQFLFAACQKSPMIQSILAPSRHSSYAVPSVEFLAMFIAVLVHDVDHPGNNNAWEIASRSDRAIKYKDIAVLEHHHAAVGLEIMKDPCNDMFSPLCISLREAARKAYVDDILQTDMAQHFSMVEQLRERKENRPAGVLSFDADSLEERRYLSGVLVHCADISNPVLPNFALVQKWANLITQEFIAQYDNEVKAGFKPTDMWKNLREPLPYYRSQVGFINFLVSPLWCTLADLIPDLKVGVHVKESIESNKSKWQQLADNEAAKISATEQPKKLV